MPRLSGDDKINVKVLDSESVNRNAVASLHKVIRHRFEEYPINFIIVSRGELD